MKKEYSDGLKILGNERYLKQLKLLILFVEIQINSLESNLKFVIGIGNKIKKLIMI